MNHFVAIARYTQQLDSELIDNVNVEVKKELAANATFDLVVRKDDLSDVDFRWHQIGQPKPNLNVLVLCLKVEGRLIAGHMSSGSALNPPATATLLNWISHVDFDVTRYAGEPPDFLKQTYLRLFLIALVWLHINMFITTRSGITLESLFVVAHVS